MKTKRFKKKYIIASIFILSVLFTLGSFGFKYLRDRFSVIFSNKESNSGEKQLLISDTQVPEPKGVPEGVELEDNLDSVIKEHLSSKFNKDMEDISVLSLQSDGSFARGAVGLKDFEGEVSVLAKKVGKTWEVLFSGTDLVPCNIVDPINFPENIMPECWDETTGQMNTRLNL